MKVGILGGTFNPVHIGHLTLAREAKEKLELVKILFVPANIPPHKQSFHIPAEHRLNMLKLAIGDNRDFEVSDIEIKRGDKSYTIDTIKELKKSFPKNDFYLIIGSDLANEFTSWKDYQEIKQLVKVVATSREGFKLENKDFFSILDITQVNVSSTQIRSDIEKGKDISNRVEKEVIEYIEKHKLYQSQ